MKNRFYIHAKTKPEDHLCEALLVWVGFAIGMTILEHNAKGAPQSRICQARRGHKLKNKVLFSCNSTLRVSKDENTI